MTTGTRMTAAAGAVVTTNITGAPRKAAAFLPLIKRQSNAIFPAS